MKTNYEQFQKILQGMLDRYLFINIFSGPLSSTPGEWAIVHAELRPGEIWFCEPFPENDHWIKRLAFDRVEVANEDPAACEWFMLYLGNATICGGSVAEEVIFPESPESAHVTYRHLVRGRQDKEQIEWVRRAVHGFTGGDRQA